MMKIKIFKKNTGFSLLELVVVIGVIGILAAASALSYERIIQNTRNKKRMVNVQQIKSDLELYKSNQINSNYPTNLNQLQSAGYVIPEDPVTKKTITAYVYRAQRSGGGGCNNTNVFCSTYELSTKLDPISEGKKYIVTPDSEKVVFLIIKKYFAYRR